MTRSSIRSAILIVLAVLLVVFVILVIGACFLKDTEHTNLDHWVHKIGLDLHLEKHSRRARVKAVRHKTGLDSRADFQGLRKHPCDQDLDQRIYTDPNTGMVFYPYVFSKTLTHNSTTGFALKSDVDDMISAIKDRSASSLAQIRQDPASVRPFVNLMAGSNFSLIGIDAQATRTQVKRPLADSERGMFELAEVYSKSLLRDVSFWDLESGANATAQQHLVYLNGFSDKSSAPLDSKQSIDAKRLHRGQLPGDLEGPYISQFLYSSFRSGSLQVDQKFRVEGDVEETTSFPDWLRMQHGELHLTPAAPSSPGVAYLHSPRGLASIVHTDPLYQFYYNATLVCQELGLEPEFGGASPVNSNWISGSFDDILQAVAGVSVEALKAAWFHKWNLNLGIRPEVLAQRIDLVQSQPTSIAPLILNCPGFATMRTYSEGKLSGLLSEVKQASLDGSSCLLKLVYPEGSPVHPTFPAGHAVVSTACVTVLKAMLRLDSQGTPLPWPGAVEHSIDGVSKVPYPQQPTLTIIGELNKLASNIASGREWAGVHFRSDFTHLLGEQVAIRYLQDLSCTYSERYSDLFTGWTLSKFDQSVIKIV